MDNDAIFLYIIAAISFLFALYNCISLAIRRNKTAQIQGTIVSISMPNPETVKARNSKWAKVSYTISGKIYTSENRIQVPMSAQVGTSVMVRYDINQPQKLYSFSGVRVFIALFIAIVCVITAVFKLS